MEGGRERGRKGERQKMGEKGTVEFRMTNRRGSESVRGKVKGTEERRDDKEEMKGNDESGKQWNGTETLNISTLKSGHPLHLLQRGISDVQNG